MKQEWLLPLKGFWDNFIFIKSFRMIAKIWTTYLILLIKLSKKLHYQTSKMERFVKIVNGL